MIRERKIDYVKGLGIILVLTGHIPSIPFEIKKIIYSFHMPLFYMLYGYNFNLNNLCNSKINYLKLMLKKYLVPYFYFNFIFLIVYTLFLNLIKIIVLKESSLLIMKRDLIKKIIGILYSRGTVEWLPNSSPLWFLTSIFSISIILYYIISINGNKQILNKKRLVLIFLCGIFFSYIKPLFRLYNSTLLEVLPFNFDTAMIGVIYTILGIKLKNKKNIKIKKKWYLVLIIFFIISIYWNKIISYDGNEYYNLVLTLISGSLGSILIFKVGEWIEKNYFFKILEILGKNSLYLMAFDYTFNFILNIFGVKNFFIYFLGKIVLALCIIYMKNILIVSRSIGEKE